MTSDELIGEYVKQMLPLVCLTNIFDTIVACFMGFVRALDPQRTWTEAFTPFVRAPSLTGEHARVKTIVFFCSFGVFAIVFTMLL